MVGWPHPLDGPEFAQALGDGKDREAWRAAVHWGHKESDTTEHPRTHIITLSVSLPLLWPLCDSTTDLFFPLYC